jgi:UDP-2,3-diacylglucosamine hydrolase
VQFYQVDSIIIPEGKAIYFASDFHLGIDGACTSLDREKILIKWLEVIASTAHHIFILGDIFDAWLEYNTVVPKGYVRFLGKLAQLTDNGINISIFTGNHDLWMYGYFQQELNIKVYYQPIKLLINDKSFLIGHGDGIGPGDKGYKALKWILNSKVCKWTYKWLHPDMGLKMAYYFSQKGLHKKQGAQPIYIKEKDNIYKYCLQHNEIQNVDYYIFGHIHFMVNISLNSHSNYINLGDWLNYFSYAVFANNSLDLKQFSFTI